MDSELQAALRWLGRGFHAGRFSTAGLLKAVGIEKCYLVSGAYNGFFLALEELRTSLITLDIVLSKKEQTAIDVWIADPSRKPTLTLDIQELRNWDEPPFQTRNPTHICIRTFDLNSSNPILQIADYLATTCDNCKETICVFDLLVCSVCNKDGCLICCVIDDLTIKRGTDIMCKDCAEKAGVLALMQQREETQE